MMVNVDISVGIMYVYIWSKWCQRNLISAHITSYNAMMLTEFCLEHLAAQDGRFRKEFAALQVRRLTADQIKSLNKVLRGLRVVPVHRRGTEKQLTRSVMKLSDKSARQFKFQKDGVETTVAVRAILT